MPPTTTEPDATKGKYKGRCNRTACETAAPALWWHFSTRAYYCAVCAKLLNLENRKDAKDLYGHVLCVYVPENPAAHGSALNEVEYLERMYSRSVGHLPVGERSEEFQWLTIYFADAMAIARRLAAQEIRYGVERVQALEAVVETTARVLKDGNPAITDTVWVPSDVNPNASLYELCLQALEVGKPPSGQMVMGLDFGVPGGDRTVVQ